MNIKELNLSKILGVAIKVMPFDKGYIYWLLCRSCEGCGWPKLKVKLLTYYLQYKWQTQIERNVHVHFSRWRLSDADAGRASRRGSVVWHEVVTDNYNYTNTHCKWTKFQTKLPNQTIKIKLKIKYWANIANIELRTIRNLKSNKISLINWSLYYHIRNYK